MKRKLLYSPGSVLPPLSAFLRFTITGICRHLKQSRDSASCLADCAIITDYDDDKPFPSSLILGKSKKGDAMHMVVSRDGEYLYLITAYYPDLDIWESDFKTRRQ